MMQRLTDLIKAIPTQNKTKIIFAVIILVVIWLILPFIPLSGGHPFAPMAIRFALTGLLILGIGVWYGIGFYQTHKLQTFSIIRDKALQTWSWVSDVGRNIGLYTKEYYVDLHDKIKRNQKKRRIKRLPWYLVLGSQQSGKRHFIQNTGLHFQRPEHIGDEALNYIKQFPDFDWWFSPQALLIDNQTFDADSDLNAWKRFVKLLKRERKGKPLNGIVLTLSLPEVVTLSHKDRQDFIQRMSNYIRDIHHVFKAHVPVYVVFNKTDLVEGFMEFFENLSKEELSQVWGMTLPIARCNDLQYVMNYFNQEYTAIINHLRKRVMWSLDTERTMRGRELINAFPQQMQLLKKPIEAFIAELFGATRYQKALQLRGLYFTSCTQGQGQSYDFLVQAMSKKFQLVPPTFKRLPRAGECYFVRSLLFKVMLPEASMLGDSERRKTVRRFVYRSALIACPALVVATGFGMHAGYTENARNLEAIDQHIQYYHSALGNIKDSNASVLGTLPAVDELERARLLYTQNSGWGTHFLLASRFIKNQVSDAEQRVLHAYFLPRIAAEIEQRLNDNMKDANMLYAYLKGYLAFSSADYTSQNAINAPMEYSWDEDFAAHPETADKLKHYLNFALQRDVEKLPLDQKLIDRIRDRLETVIPSERAYGLLSLRASVSDYPDVLLSTAAGSEFDSVFIEDDPSYRVPRLYTDAVYQHIYLPHYEDIAEEVANDNKDIGLSSASDAKDTESDLEDNIQTTYNTRYTRAWQKALDNIHVKSFTSLKEAVNTLDALIGKDSPLPKVLNIVYDNTNDVSHDKVQVVGHFEDVNDYSEGGHWGASWQDSVKTLTKLRDYLVKLEQAPNQSQASFIAAKAVIQGSDNPMQQLAKQAENAPQPVQRWLRQLANQCWQIIVLSAYQEINHAWDDQIRVTYDKGMRDRFPFNVASDSDVDIADFNHVFGSGQALDKFFNQYIKPFVNTDEDDGHWQLYNVHGLTMEFSPQLLAMFQQAKQIQREFFPNDASETKFVLNIKPLTLSDKAASVEFVAGPQQMLYSHGPQNVSTVTWPLPFNDETSRIVITDFKSNQYSRWANGSWSLFKLFQKGDFHATGDDGSYRFDVNFKGYAASYEITGPSDMAIFTLKNLKGFTMPSQIEPVIPSTKKQESDND